MAKSKRISGENMDGENGLAYATQQDGKWRIDLAGIRARIDAYLAEATETGRYSISGLCISLGITRETLSRWRAGYICAADENSARIAPNGALADLIAKAELYVERYWEECDESKMQSKHTKLLESAGVMDTGAHRQQLRPPFDMGRLKKYCR